MAHCSDVFLLFRSTNSTSQTMFIPLHAEMPDLQAISSVPGGAAARPSKSHNYGKGELEFTGSLVDTPPGGLVFGPGPAQIDFRTPDRPPGIPILPSDYTGEGPVIFD